MIPPFEKNNVLPPYLGSTPTERGKQSPYKSNIMEVCKFFAKTQAILWQNSVGIEYVY